MPLSEVLAELIQLESKCVSRSLAYLIWCTCIWKMTLYMKHCIHIVLISVTNVNNSVCPTVESSIHTKGSY